MNSRIVVLYSCILLTSCTSFASEGQVKNCRVTAAYDADGAIAFDSPVDLNWHTLAPKTYEIPSADIIREMPTNRGSYREGEVTYKLPLDAGLAGWRHYAMTETGLSFIEAQSMLGTIQFHSESMVEKLQRQDSGQIIGSLSTHSSSEPQFVLSVFDGIQISTLTQPCDPNKFRLALAKSGSWAWELNSDLDAWDLSICYGISLGDPKSGYSFIKQVPNTHCKFNCCEARYFVVAQEDYEILSWHLYGCVE